MEYYNGIYEGEWKNGKREGEGIEKQEWMDYERLKGELESNV